PPRGDAAYHALSAQQPRRHTYCIYMLCCQGNPGKTDRSVEPDPQASEAPAWFPPLEQPGEASRMTFHPDDLIIRGLVAPERLGELRRVAEEFAVAVTEDMAGLIDPADPKDP